MDETEIKKDCHVKFRAEGEPKNIEIDIKLTKNQLKDLASGELELAGCDLEFNIKQIIELWKNSKRGKILLAVTKSD